MASKVRRPQTSKASRGIVMNKKWDKDRVQGMQELRRSNAAGPHRTATDYRRKPKHVGRGYED